MKSYNCPHCGAPISRTSDHCVYCGAAVDWIPTLNVYFTPQTYDKVVLESRATIDLDHIRLAPEFEQRIKYDLAHNMAKQIPDVWDVRYDDDPIRFRRLYIARLPVWQKRYEE